MAENPVTEMSDGELISELAAGKRELFNLRFQLATGQLENSARIRQVKKNVARVSTEIRAREIAAAEELAAASAGGES
jgi:large subunit ribosomal protein L29